MKKLKMIVVVGVLVAACSVAKAATWEPMDSPTTAALTNIWGSGSDDVFAIGNPGTILHYDGDGDNDGIPDDIWEQMPSSPTANLVGIWGFGPNDVYIGGFECPMLHYDGITWEPVPGMPPTNISQLSYMWGSEPNNLFVTGEGYDNTIGHVFHWNGSAWSDLTFSFPLVSGVLYEVWGRGPNDVYVSGYNGYSSDSTGVMYHYDGNTWELFHPDGKGDHDLPKTRAISGIWGSSDSAELFLAGMTYGDPSNWFGEALHYYGGPWSTQYDPTKWETEVFHTANAHGLKDVWGSSPCDVYMIGRNGVIVHYDGISWSEMDSGTTENLSGIWGSGPGDVFAVGNNGTILRLSEPEPPCELEMVLIPGGEFEMGDHHGDGGSDELPIHAVKVDSFYMGKYEITNQQYCDYLNSAYPGQIKVDSGVVYASSDSGNDYPYCDTHSADADSQIDYNDISGTFSVRTKGEPPRDMNDDPMVEVSWYGAKAFCDYYGYRLPTEAEWEYAARGGNHNLYYRFPWGDTISHSQANYNSNRPYSYDVSPTSGYHPLWNGVNPDTSPVGFFDGTMKYKVDYNWPGSDTSYQTTSGANGYGLYDMEGNVWEWCNDWYGSNYYSASPYDNPQGPASGTYRVLRGGCWGFNAFYCRVAYRHDYLSPYDRSDGFGFRIVRNAEPPEPNISVSPLSHDFGDVELGTSRTVIVTISNTGTGNLTVSGIALETDFAITSAPAAAILVEPGATKDVEITYTPSTPGHNSAVLKITSDDPDEPMVEVTLGAVGIEIPPPPSEQIANILTFFDESVEQGALAGDGPGNSAEKRLNALRNMIEAAGDLIERDLFEEACQQLLDARRRMDGQPAPPDFVKGEAVSELASMVQDLMTTLGCE